ncbi:MBL fold metallo-hydrolase [Lewinella cohaerens]|uniref:MBL fold metallo-hydrolase n=1 Tax=Lewinella cohaerens TaxID=70995 RepID=UPI0003615358|nr:MBL fold metallo-hydrolase [Lewinella cohaerens]
MKIHHLRNATLIIESGPLHILVDPMLGKRGAFMPFTLFRFKARRNPLVNLPDNSEALLAKVTHCLITHQHPDHIDDAGVAFLRDKQIPVICSQKDTRALERRDLSVSLSLEYGEITSALGGSVTGIPARHGYGFIAGPMGNVMGFYLELSEAPTLYISADTIYTKAVDDVLRNSRPAISIVAGGAAQLDVGSPLLMTIEDIVKFVRNAPGQVVINHLEALNHCPTTRQQLRTLLQEQELLYKAYLPEDGETLVFE